VTDRARPLVLIVEDHDDSREVYAELLELSGYEVACAADGLSAVESALAVQPDVILIDFSLPGIDGAEATRRIRADERTARIPVVILTGMPAEAMTPVECDARVSKPCSPESILREIERLVDRGR
jgi:CheY-like chemotaxis protein